VIRLKMLTEFVEFEKAVASTEPNFATGQLPSVFSNEAPNRNRFTAEVDATEGPKKPRYEPSVCHTCCSENSQFLQRCRRMSNKVAANEAAEHPQERVAVGMEFQETVSCGTAQKRRRSNNGAVRRCLHRHVLPTFRMTAYFTDLLPTNDLFWLGS